MREVNHSVEKLDGKGLMMGRPAYTEDLAPQNALVVKALRSPYAFARIKSIEADQARAIPGVACVLTHQDLPRNVITRAGQGYPEPSPYDKFILDEFVRYIGDEVAIVAAVTEEQVNEALKLIQVEYEILPAVLDYEEAEGHVSVIHPEPESHSKFDIGMDAARNIAASYHMEVGDVEEVLKDCEVVIHDRYYTQAQAHVMMEPHIATAYYDFYGRLTVISSTQTPFHARRVIGQALNIPRKDIRVIKPRIGGGFGGKQMTHCEPLVAAVTWKTGKPAKMLFTREEVFESSFTRHPMRFDVTVGATRDGQIKAIDFNVLSDTGAYGEHALTVLMGAGSKPLPIYNKVEAVRFNGKVVYSNHVPAGAYRGYGAIQGAFAMESAVDQLAETLKMSPVDLRQKNIIREGETSPIFKIMGEGGEGVAMTIDSCKLDYCIKRGMELIGWREKFPRQTVGAHKVRGVGMAIAMQGSGIANIDMASAIIKLNDDGFFNLLVGATDIGTGSDTILAQIAAESLHVDTRSIVVYSSDTDLTPFDKGAYASSTTYVSGNAVKKAADNMQRMILSEGARKLRVAEDKVTFDGETVSRSDGKGSIALKDLATGLFYHANQRQLIASDSYVGQKSPPPFMAGFAEVEVDLETGKVDLVHYAAVVDCGTTINPNLARIQVEGGLVQGIGMAMFEEVKYGRDGNLLSNNMLFYNIPTRKDIRKITVEFADSYEPSGPYGAKSVGEIGIDTPPAAIANAVYHATGIRLRNLPITPEKVLMALKTKGE
ncbi:MAG TPA: molybdopterin cofactor-binding domain-containing protein [Bacillota bacterium]|nr:molybdopterin cofactor-binding domain-containing protein [Bacillota bacterium]